MFSYIHLMPIDLFVITFMVSLGMTIWYRCLRTTMPMRTHVYTPTMSISVRMCTLYNSTTMEVIMRGTRTECEAMQDHMGTKYSTPTHIHA